MRCISRHGEYSLQIRPQRQIGMGDGSIQVTQEGIYAKFDKDGLVYENEREKAEKVFTFNGRFQHFDEATPAEIDYRLSVFDTDEQNYDEETKALVEAELQRKASITGDFFIVEETPIAPPFPAWDTSEKPAFQLVSDLAEMGFDLQLALDYEKLFGPRRAAVIEALEETLADREMETVEA